MDSETKTIGGRGYLFPILRTNNIVECLKDLEMDVMTKQELQEPQKNKEKVRKLYAQMLFHLTLKSDEDFKKPDPKIMAHVNENSDPYDYPELHDAASFAELRFFLALRKLFETCSYYEFSWRDLDRPNPKRLREQLSALLNLCKFREEQLPLYETVNENRIRLLSALEKVNNENVILEEELIAVEQECQDSMSKMEEVMQEIQEIELEIARNNKMQTASRKEIDELQNKIEYFKDEIVNVTCALKDAKAKEQDLNSQIVSSPDRLKDELQRKQNALDAEKEFCWDMEEKTKECKIKIHNLQQAIKDLQSAQEHLIDLVTQAAKYKEMIQAYEATLDKIKAIEKETAEIIDYTQEAERTLQRAEEKIPSQRKQFELQLEATEEALDRTKSQLQVVEKERRTAMARLKAGEDEVQSLEKAMELEKAKTDREIAEMVNVYKTAERAVKERQHRLLSLFKLNSN